MNTFMKTASGLALATALAVSPFAATAQTATTDSTAQTDPAVTTDTTAQQNTEEMAEPENEETTAEGATEEEVPAEGTMTTEQAVPTEGTDTAETVPGADPMNQTEAVEVETETVEAEEVTKPVEGQIVMQGENTILADDLIGTNVYSQDGDSIGEIDNLIVNLDGTVEGVVIGVGGFLGLGEKDVAIEMSSLSISTGENGDMRLLTSSTRADLEAAEAFVTKDQMEAAEASMETMPVQDGSIPAPAPASN